VALPSSPQKIKTTCFLIVPLLFSVAVGIARSSAVIERAFVITKDKVGIIYQYSQDTVNFVYDQSIDGLSTLIYPEGPPPSTVTGVFVQELRKTIDRFYDGYWLQSNALVYS
jgi:hypothetical protein